MNRATLRGYWRRRYRATANGNRAAGLTAHGTPKVRQMLSAAEKQRRARNRWAARVSAFARLGLNTRGKPCRYRLNAVVARNAAVAVRIATQNCQRIKAESTARAFTLASAFNRRGDS